MRNQTRRHLPNQGDVAIGEIVALAPQADVIIEKTPEGFSPVKRRVIAKRFAFVAKKRCPVHLDLEWQRIRVKFIAPPIPLQGMPDRNGRYSNIDIPVFKSRLENYTSITSVDLEELKHVAAIAEESDTIVEISSKDGISTAALRQGAIEGVKIISIESRVAEATLMGVQPELDDVEIVVGNIRSYVQELSNISILSYRAPEDEATCEWYIETLWPLVVDGGIICVSDAKGESDGEWWRLFVGEAFKRRWKCRITTDQPSKDHDDGENCLAIIQVPG